MPRDDGAIVRLGPPTWRRVGEPWPGRGTRVTGIASAPDGSLLATAIEDGGVALLDPRGGQRLDTLKPETESPPHESEGSPGAWADALTMGRRPLGAPSAAQIAFSPDGRWLVVERTAGLFVLRDLQAKSARTIQIPATPGIPLARLSGQLRLAFGAGGLLATAQTTRGSPSLKLWNATTGEPLGEPLSEWAKYLGGNGRVLSRLSDGQRKTPSNSLTIIRNEVS